MWSRSEPRAQRHRPAGRKEASRFVRPVRSESARGHGIMGSAKSASEKEKGGARSFAAPSRVECERVVGWGSGPLKHSLRRQRKQQEHTPAALVLVHPERPGRPTSPGRFGVARRPCAQRRLAHAKYRQKRTRTWAPRLAAASRSPASLSGHLPPAGAGGEPAERARGRSVASCGPRSRRVCAALLSDTNRAEAWAAGVAGQQNLGVAHAETPRAGARRTCGPDLLSSESMALAGAMRVHRRRRATSLPRGAFAAGRSMLCWSSSAAHVSQPLHISLRGKYLLFGSGHRIVFVPVAFLFVYGVTHLWPYLDEG